MRLGEIAHARSGDKGNISNISLIVYDSKDYALVAAKVTSAVVKAWFAGQVKGEVIRYELPQLGALNFVLFEALKGGVTCATSLDKHGKTLSSILLEMEI
ncbi:hypothetical protein N8873_01765 [Flavobacteriaceae bacterium]|nr:hypothetical protein [Flavobacteriaceae bacterium]